jgi:hypothetical protein
MDEVDSRIRDTLLFIKESPHCCFEESGLDGDLIHDLIKQRLVEGCDTSTIHVTTRTFAQLRITTEGEKKLASLKSAVILKGAKAMSSLAISVIAGVIVTVIAIFYLQPWQDNN